MSNRKDKRSQNPQFENVTARLVGESQKVNYHFSPKAVHPDLALASWCGIDVVKVKYWY